MRRGACDPDILVTAYPDEVGRNRALKDGVVCYLRKPVDDDISSVVFVRLSSPVGRLKKFMIVPVRAGKVN